MKRLLIIVLLALCSTPCFAWDGNQLLGYCDHAGSSEYHLCLGYVAGVADRLNWMSIICIGGIKYSQMSKVVEKYLTNNPELLHRNANNLVKNALVKAFPCK